VGVTGAEAIVRVLEEAGVDVVFGLCGDTSLPFYDALARTGSLRHVLTRDERSASFMADAYARLSGRIGVCEGPSGGGATYIIPGVAEANGSSVPMVCLTSDVGVGDRGKGTLTEMDQQALFSSLTRTAFAPSTAEEMEDMVRAAFREAMADGLGACHVSLPLDLQCAMLDRGPERGRAPDGDGPRDGDSTHGGSPAHGGSTSRGVGDGSRGSLNDRYPAVRPAPAPDDVTRAARILADARRPVIVAGAGVIRSGAWSAVGALSRALGAPVATSICGKGAVAETDPLALGVVGSNGGLPWRHELLRQADVVFQVAGGTGSVTTEKWTLPAPGEARFVQLDVDAGRLGRSHAIDAALRCDARTGLDAVTDALVRNGAGGEGDRFDPEEIRAAKANHRARVAELFASSDTPIRPERLFGALFDALPDDSIILADPGTPCPYVSAYWELRKPGRWFVSPRAFGALGYALPAVVGAWHARPEAGRVVGVMGDGSFGISAGELETLVRLDVPATLIVCNNAGYGWIKAGQKSRGDRYYAVDFRRSDHAAIAEAYGMRARRVEDPEELPVALRQALSHRGPFLLDVVTQPLEEANAPVSKWIA